MNYKIVSLITIALLGLGILYNNFHSKEGAQTLSFGVPEHTLTGLTYTYATSIQESDDTLVSSNAEFPLEEVTDFTFELQQEDGFLVGLDPYENDSLRVTFVHEDDLYSFTTYPGVTFDVGPTSFLSIPKAFAHEGHDEAVSHESPVQHSVPVYFQLPGLYKGFIEYKEAGVPGIQVKVETFTVPEPADRGFFRSIFK